MNSRTLSAILVCVFALAGYLLAADKPAVPAEATGFHGTLEGTIAKKAPGGNWVLVAVTSAQPDAKSKVKDGKALVGKEVPVATRLAGNTPQPDQKAYFDSLNVGDKVTLQVVYNDNAGGAIRLAAVPGDAKAPAAATAATPTTEPAAEPKKPALNVQQAVLGNIFLEGEPVKIFCPGEGQSVEYVVKDYWAQTVDSGTAPVKEGLATITPDLKKKIGYFTLSVNGGAVEMTFAVLAPVNVKDPAHNPFGAVTHFAKGMNTDIIPLLSRLGIYQVRDEHPWNQLEKQKGEYAFAKFEPYMAELKKAGITPLEVMAFGNKNYDVQPKVDPPVAAPHTDNGRAAYAKYCSEVMKHYGSQIQTAEIWNEYNGTFCKGEAAKDRPRYYTLMCKEAYQAIKKADPSATVIGCGSVLIPLVYIEGIFKNGGLDYMDGVVIHPYRNEPEGMDRELVELNDLMKKYNHGKTKPIWCTEYGWGDFNADTPENVARYLVRSSVLMRSQNVQRMYWYLLRDFAEFPTMGLVHGDADSRGKYSPAPAGAAMANMIRLLNHAAFDTQEAHRPYSKAYVFKFKGGGEELRVCWSTAANCKVTAEADGPVTRIDLMGNETQLAPEGGRIELTLDETPFYLKGNIKSVSENPTAWTAIAGNMDDFAPEQGRNGWRFGYYPGAGIIPLAHAMPQTRDFKDMTLEQTVWGNEWSGRESKIKQGKLVAKANEWPAMRWVSSVDGKVQITGEFSLRNGKKNPSDGVDVAITVDNQRVYIADIFPTAVNRTFEAKFDAGADVHKGSVIDFIVTAGSAGKDAGDNVKLDATINVPTR